MQSTDRTFRLRAPKLAPLLLVFLAPVGVAAPATPASPTVTYSIQLPAFLLPESVQTDARGNAYIFGSPPDPKQPLPVTQGALYTAPSTRPDISSYLMKLDNRGRVVFVTYMLGTTQHCAIDGAGNIYLTGRTTDAPGKFYVAEIDSTGSKLLYFRTFGGNGFVRTGRPEDAVSIGLDSQGNVYVAGNTLSTDFPVTPGALQSSFTGVFVMKLNPKTDQIVYSTFLGGLGGATAARLTVDQSGDAYVIGIGAADFSVTSGAFQTAPPVATGGYYVAKLDPTGSKLVYATFFPAWLQGIAVDSDSAVYLTGAAGSGLSFTTELISPGGLGAVNCPLWSLGCGPVFVAKLNPDGASLAYATHLGGGVGAGLELMAAPSGDMIVGGVILSTGIPTVSPFQASVSPSVVAKACGWCPECSIQYRSGPCAGGFLARLDDSGSNLVWSSYVGAAGTFEANAVPVGIDTAGNVYAVGKLPGVAIPGIKSSGAALFKLEPDGIPPLVGRGAIVSSAGFSTAVAQGGLGTIFGSGLAPDINRVISAASFPLPTELAGVSVWASGTPMPLLAVANVNGQEQINFQMPFDYPLFIGQDEMIMIRTPRGVGFTFAAGFDGGVGSNTAAIFGSERGGTPAIVHGADYSLVTTSNPAHPGETIVIYATGLGPVDPPVPTGAAAPNAPLSRTPSVASVTIGGTAAIVSFSGLAPGYAGLYQINAVVPQVAAGIQKVTIWSGPPATMAVAAN